MGTDFHLKSCQVETRKVLWVIGLVLASVLLIQYFELPYRDSMLSLLSSGKSYFDFSDPNKGANRNIEYNSSSSSSSSSIMPNLKDGEISAEIFLPERTTEMNHTAEEETVERSIRIAPENAVADISPISTYTVELGIAASPDKASDAMYKVLSTGNANADISPSVSFIGNSTISIKSGENARFDHSLAPMASPFHSISIRNMDINIGAPIIGNENETSWKKNDEKLKGDNITLTSSTTNNSPPPPSKERPPESPAANVVSISEMNDMLLRSRVSSFSKSPPWPSAADQELLDARFQIEHGAAVGDHPGLYAPIYRNISTFGRSYEIMEQKLKIYIYKDGKRPVFHQPRLKGIYASEGWFMKLLKSSNQFVTTNPGEAQLFYLPFSSQLLVDYVYVPDSHSFHEINEYLKNYINTIKARYPFWNRTDGVDHFLVACHDWAPIETRRLMANCIRALCNSDVKEGFQFGKDVSLPETYIHSPQNPLTQIGGSPPSKRKIIAFFAGKMHGYVRPILLQNWENKDPDMKIFGHMKKESYIWHMKNSKYCICAKGYEVNSPRVVEAIAYGCVPVIISDNFAPPFFDVLNWEMFAVFVLEKDIPNLKGILVSISERRYVVMQQRVKQVRQHFLWHNKPVKYDIFHMILHSVWYNRVLRLSSPK